MKTPPQVPVYQFHEAPIPRSPPERKRESFVPVQTWSELAEIESAGCEAERSEVETNPDVLEQYRSWTKKL